MGITRVGADSENTVFHVHGVGRHDKTLWQAKFKRNQWLGALCTRVTPGAGIGMEACASAHHASRELL